MMNMKVKQLIFLPILLMTVTALNAKDMQESLAAIEQSFGGRIGVYALNTENAEEITFRAGERFPVQSTFKLLAVAAILNEDDKWLAQHIMCDKSDLVSWSPITENHLDQGMTKLSLCEASMTHSDNTATNLVIEFLGGIEAVNEYVLTLGDNTSTLDHYEPKLNSDPEKLADTSTPKAMAHNLQKLILGDALAESRRELLKKWMINNKTGDARIRAGVPKNWIVADKTGSGRYGIANDIAVIWPAGCKPIVVAIYTVQNDKDASIRDDVVAAASKTVVGEFMKADSCLKN